MGEMARLGIMGLWHQPLPNRNEGQSFLASATQYRNTSHSGTVPCALYVPVLFPATLGGMTGPPLPVIPFYSLTLGNLVAARAVLLAARGACSRQASMDVMPLLARLGPRFGVRDLERRLKRDRCGRKRLTTVRVEWL